MEMIYGFIITGMSFCFGFIVSGLLLNYKYKGQDPEILNNRIEGLLDRIKELENESRNKDVVRGAIERAFYKQKEKHEFYKKHFKRERGFKQLFYYLLERRIEKHRKATKHCSELVNTLNLSSAQTDKATSQTDELLRLFDELQLSNKRLEQYKGVI